MIGRPFRVDWRTEDTPEALKAAYLAERDGTLRSRLHGLWLLRSGRQLSEVASVVGVHYRTVQSWVGWYRQAGVQEVLSHKKGGRGTPRYLSTEEERGLAQEVSEGRFKTAGEIRDWIESEYEVSYKPGGVYSLLKRLGCSPKVPRAFHEKADVDVIGVNYFCRCASIILAGCPPFEDAVELHRSDSWGRRTPG